MSSNLNDVFGKAKDHAIAYREGVAADPLPLARTYHDIRDALASPVPENGMDASLVIDELVAATEGGLMPIVGPRFFGWVMGSSHPAGVAADWLVSAWGQNAAFHSSTPAMAAIEEVAEGWLVDLLDLPAGSAVGFTTGATVANGVCLAAARTGTLLKHDWDPDADGLFGAPPVHVFIGADAHSSLFSSLQLIGFGYNRVTRIETDDQGAMLAPALEREIGKVSGPKIVIAQAGQINTGSYDPFTEIVAIAKAHDAWVHVDGAFGLWTRASLELKHLTDGIEGCDSWCTDGHKWLQAPYDSGFAIVRDRDLHQRAMTQWSSYLPTMAEGDRVPSAYVPELSRRARGVPVWAVIKAFGRQGISQLVERHCRLARRFAERLAAEPGIRILNDVRINQTIVNFDADNAADRRALTEAVIAGVQKDGVCFVGGAAWRGEWVMRISVISEPTTERDIDLSADAIIAAWRNVQRGERKL